MPYLDQDIIKNVAKVFPEVEIRELENLIFHINKDYAQAKCSGELVDFVKIRDSAMEHCGLWDLFTYKLYKTAIGKYYALKRARDEREKLIVGTVYKASESEALIAASENVKIMFCSRLPKGRLKYHEIDSGHERFSRTGKNTRVTESEYACAKRQALAIINGRRGF